MKEKIYGIVLMLLLANFLIFAFNLQILKASNTIFILPDGTIDPPDVNITRNGNLYTFADDINDSIVIQKDNVVLDGAGYTLRGTGSGEGIYMYERGRIEITNIDIRNFRYGIYLYYCSDINITKNNITSIQSKAIHVMSSSDNIISGNIIEDCADYGLWLRGSSHNLVVGNNLRNTTTGIKLEPVSSLNDIQNNTLSSMDDCIYITGDCTHNRVFENNCTHSWRGLLLIAPNNSVFENNIVMCHDGINLAFYSNNNVSWNTLEHCYGDGIVLESSSSNNVTNNYLTSRYWIEPPLHWWTGTGIRLMVDSNHNFIYDNVAVNQTKGIVLDSSTGNILRNNSMVKCKYNLLVDGSNVSHFEHDIDSSNKVDLKSIIYLIDRQDLIIESHTYPDMGYLALINSRNAVVRNLESVKCVFLAYTENSLIQNLTTMTSGTCIKLHSSSYNAIYRNTLTNATCGILLYNSTQNSVLRNNVISSLKDINVTSGSTGIDLGHLSAKNLVCRNNVTNNNSGLRLDGSLNIIYENNIKDNEYGIAINSYNDTFHHNNFMDNIHQVTNDSMFWRRGHSWDDGYPSGGNYWSDYDGSDLYYGPYQNETGSDGIGDTPYLISVYNYTNPNGNETTIINYTDRYPLMNPWVPTEPITATFLNPIEPTTHDPVTVSVICDFEAEKVILCYKDTGNQWWNASMIYNNTLGLWVTVIPAQYKYCTNKTWEQNGSIVEFYTELVFNSGNKTISRVYRYTVESIIAEDINCDGKVDMKDVGGVARLFGHQYP